MTLTGSGLFLRLSIAMLRPPLSHAFHPRLLCFMHCAGGPVESVLQREHSQLAQLPGARNLPMVQRLAGKEIAHGVAAYDVLRDPLRRRVSFGIIKSIVVLEITSEEDSFGTTREIRLQWAS